MPPSADTSDLLAAIRRVVRAVRRAERADRRERGLSAAQQLTLQVIGEQEDGTTARELLPRVQVSAGTLSGIVDALVKAGLVARARRVSDRRSVLLTLTEAGHALRQVEGASFHDRVVTRMEALPDAERRRLLDALDTIAVLLGAGDLDASPILSTDEPLADR